MKLSHTRALLSAALSGDLAQVPFVEDAVFGLSIPTSCSGVPSEVLDPRNTWADKDAYDARASELKKMFDENYRKFA